MIELRGVSKRFNQGSVNEVLALSEIDLKVDHGEFVVVVGSNGSGKSTMLNVLAGSILPSSGSVWMGGRDVSRLPDYRRSPWVARVFQNPLSGTAPDLAVIDNFRLAALRTRRKGLGIGLDVKFRKLVAERIASLEMGLETKLDQPMGSLSGGQRQALTLLMSVMDDLQILLLDEPTAALDPRSANMVMEIADKIVREYHLTALLVTHHIPDAARFGTRVIQMVDGRIAKDISGEAKQSMLPADLYAWFSL